MRRKKGELSGLKAACLLEPNQVPESAAPVFTRPIRSRALCRGSQAIPDPHTNAVREVFSLPLEGRGNQAVEPLPLTLGTHITDQAAAALTLKAGLAQGGLSPSKCFFPIAVRNWPRVLNATDLDVHRCELVISPELYF